MCDCAIFTIRSVEFQVINEWNIFFSNKVSLNFCCMCSKTNYCGQTEPSCDPKASTKQGHIPAGSRRRSDVITTSMQRHRRKYDATATPCVRRDPYCLDYS